MAKHHITKACFPFLSCHLNCTCPAPPKSLSPQMCACWEDETDTWSFSVYQTESSVKYLPLHRGNTVWPVLKEELTGNSKSCVERQLTERKLSCTLSAHQVLFLLWSLCKVSDCAHTANNLGTVQSGVFDAFCMQSLSFTYTCFAPQFQNIKQNKTKTA